MNDKSKLMLSDGEMQLVTNTNWILTKRTIIDKVDSLFGGLTEAMKDIIIAQQEYLPPMAITSTPKIAKGENYRLLPYVILDYPRCFDKENVFAVRTMFWWGNFFSCTLHLSGLYKIKFKKALLHNLLATKNDNLYICINKDEWQHHFEKENYLPVITLSEEEITTILSSQHFLKVAAKFSLLQWNEMGSLLEKSFSDVLHLLQY
jgi:hypothetical protein